MSKQEFLASELGATAERIVAPSGQRRSLDPCQTTESQWARCTGLPGERWNRGLRKRGRNSKKQWPPPPDQRGETLWGRAKKAPPRLDRGEPLPFELPRAAILPWIRHRPWPARVGLSSRNAGRFQVHTFRLTAELPLKHSKSLPSPAAIGGTRPVKGLNKGRDGGRPCNASSGRQHASNGYRQPEQHTRGCPCCME